MYYELNIFVNDKSCKVFLQNGFYSFSSPLNSTHKHNYTEIHLISNGNATFRVGKEVFTVGGGEMMVIPKGIFHSWNIDSSDTLHSAFQIDLPIDLPHVISADVSVINGFFNEILKYRTTNDHTVIAAYIPLICSYLKGSNFEHINNVSDGGILIEMFFSTSYDKDVRLCDLAEILHLSERQTERLIKEHTGHTFKEELAATRISVARYLLQTTNMSLSEVAQYVGYHSYAGFWKAMQKYGSQ